MKRSIIPVTANKRRPFKWPSFIFPLIFALLLFFGLLYFFLGSSFFIVRNISVEGSSEEIRQKTADVAKENLIEETNIWLITFNKTIEKIKEEHGIIENIELKRVLPSEIKMILHERQPAILWQTGDQIFAVDTIGVAYQKEKDKKDVTKVYDLKCLPVETGEKIVSELFVGFALELSGKFEENSGKKARRYSISETTFEITVRTLGGMQVFFDTTRSVDTQLRNLKMVLDSLPKGLKLSYIDVRVDGRVYYK